LRRKQAGGRPASSAAPVARASGQQGSSTSPTAAAAAAPDAPAELPAAAVIPPKSPEKPEPSPVNAINVVPASPTPAMQPTDAAALPQVDPPASSDVSEVSD
jgi:hypothetical protein